MNQLNKSLYLLNSVLLMPFLDIFTIRCSSLCQYLFPHKFYQIFEKTFGGRWKAFFSFLVSAALFLSFALILENKSEALSRKSVILRVQIAIRKSFENITP